jgi:hypothetical protein
MNSLLNVLRSFAAWWREGLAAMGTHALLESQWPVNGDPGLEIDRETAEEEERARLALLPWWV